MTKRKLLRSNFKVLFDYANETKDRKQLKLLNDFVKHILTMGIEFHIDNLYDILVYVQIHEYYKKANYELRAYALLGVILSLIPGHFNKVTVVMRSMEAYGTSIIHLNSFSYTAVGTSYALLQVDRTDLYTNHDFILNDPKSEYDDHEEHRAFYIYLERFKTHEFLQRNINEFKNAR